MVCRGLWAKKSTQFRWPGDGRRQPDRDRLRCELSQTGKPQAQQVASLGGHERMQLIQHNDAQPGKHARRVLVREQQRHLLRRGHQNVRRVVALSLPPRRGRIAGPRLERNVETHLLDRRAQVACDIDGQGFQRRYVKRVNSRCRAPFPV